MQFAADTVNQKQNLHTLNIKYKTLSQFPGNFMLDYLVHCNTNPNPIFAMCLMMCCKKSKFKGDPLKFEKINDGSCETRHNVILQMSLCDILKNHPFAITAQPNKSPNTKHVSFCVGKNPIWMEESQFFPKNQLCASETLRSPILTPFFTVF